MSEYVARIARRVTANMDLTAEARLKPSLDEDREEEATEPDSEIESNRDDEKNSYVCRGSPK